MLHSYISTIFLTILFLSLAFFLLILPWGTKIYQLAFKDPSFTFYPYGITTVSIAAVNSINSIISFYLRNSKQPLLFVFFSGGSFILSIISEALAVIHFHARAADVLIVRLSVLGFVSIVTWSLLLRKTGLRFDRRFLRASLSYSLPIIPYVLFGFIYMSYDRIMIEQYLNMTSVAIYNLAASIAVLSDTALSSLENTTAPLVYEKLKESAKQNANYVSRIFRGIGLSVYSIIALLCMMAPIVIIFFLKPIYLQALILLPVLMIGYIFRYLYSLYVDPLFFFKKTKQLPWLNVVAGTITVIANMILLPVWGLWGAAASMLLARGAQLLLTYYLYRKYSYFRYNLTYIRPISIGLILILLSISLYHYWIPNMHYVFFITYSLPLFFISVFMFLYLKNKLSFRNIISKAWVVSVKNAL